MSIIIRTVDTHGRVEYAKENTDGIYFVWDFNHELPRQKDMAVCNYAAVSRALMEEAWEITGWATTRG